MKKHVKIGVGVRDTLIHHQTVDREQWVISDYQAAGFKSEYRISKSETNSNVQIPNVPNDSNADYFGFEFW
jgi:hypothetical protein